MKALLKHLFIFIFIALFAGAIAAGYFLNDFFLKRPAPGLAAVAFPIDKGESVKKISQSLKDAGIINNVFMFEAYVWLVGREGVFQPGEYNLKAGTNIASLVGDLTAINVRENQFTLIEGWDLKDMAEYLKEKKLIRQDSEWYFLTGRPGVDYRKNKIDFQGGWNYGFLADKPAYVSLEGYIYPDTYKILAEGNAEGLMKKALNNFDKKLTSELREEIKKQGKTIFEVVTLASIVEKEVSAYEDRRIAADLFWRRLAKGMALQADSTVNYITDSGRARSTFDDLKIDSPWNTYKYAGLPLGPISNPSIEAIRAVVYPQKNNYLYFLTGKDGKVYYAKTSAEHIRNRKYLE
jgi:UPF0755 protein